MQELGRELGAECLGRGLEEAGSEGAEEERSRQTARSAVREGRGGRVSGSVLNRAVWLEVGRGGGDRRRGGSPV